MVAKQNIKRYQVFKSDTLTAECFLVKTNRYPLYTKLTRKIFAYGVIRLFSSVKTHDPVLLFAVRLVGYPLWTMKG